MGGPCGGGEVGIYLGQIVVLREKGICFMRERFLGSVLGVSKL